MTTFKNYITSRPFLINLGCIVALIFILVFGTLKWLSSYTNHGDFVEVPDFKGQTILGLDEFVKDKDVSFQIIDSIYDPKEKPGTVIRQDPELKSKVKHNRTVYLYVTGMVPPQIVMPRLIDRSERQARLIISSYGLKVGRIKEMRADCNGCVLEQSVRGHIIEAGKSVPKGSAVDLLIGKKDAYSGAVTDSLSTSTQNEKED
jgi:beta-lactam-binding protein with PASTA domain